MASKFKRNSRWYVSYKDEHGTWRKKSLRTEERADAFLRSLEEPSATAPAVVPLARSCHFPTAARDYMTRLSIYGRPASISHATVSVKHLTGVFATADLATLESSAIDRYVLHRRCKGVVDRTINGELIVFRAIVNHAVETGALEIKPFKIRLLKITKKLPKALTSDQVQTLLSHADHRTRPVLVTALHTGFRFQELISLNWSDVDFQRRTISVTTKPEIGFSPKAHVERANPMSDRLVAVLKQHRQNLIHDRPSDPVFQMKAGVRWTTRLIQVINKLYREAGLYSRKEKSGLHQWYPFDEPRR